MSLDFCAIDFETANSFRGSPCAVGLARVMDGQIVETGRLLMRPPEGFDHFDAFNIWIHGITPEMVKGQPLFAERLPEILAFAGGTQLFVEPQLLSQASVGVAGRDYSPNQLSYDFAFQNNDVNTAAAISVELLLIGLIVAALFVARSGFFDAD